MRKRSSMNRLLSLVMAVVLVLSLAAPAFAAEQTAQNFAEVDNIFGSKLSARQEAQQEDSKQERDPNEVVRVSIVLEEKSTVEAGFAPIDIAANSDAMAYRETLKVAQDELTGTISRAIGSELDVVWNLTLAANLISANVKYGQIETIAAIPGVAAVFEEATYLPPEPVEDGDTVSPDMAQSKSQIGSDTAWAAGYTGAGSVVAIIDTGLDYQHEAFSAEAFEYSLRQLGGSVDLMTKDDISSVLRQLNVYSRKSGVSASSLYYNSKVPFGFNYAQNNYTITHSSQAGEHGSHVAGISAANKYVKRSGTFYKALDKTSVQGVAPDAQLLIMNVFGSSAGCSSSDYMAAIEDAVILGADSVNLSLGSGNPGFACSYYYEEILNELVQSGVVVAMSAGNSGHWYDAAINEMPFLYLDDVSSHTGGSPGTYANSLCVASVESANAATASYYDMSSFSSWGVPGDLTMKPEISAPGGNIYSVAGYVPSYITNHTSYEYMSGTSMASPQVAGMAAVVAQYIRENNLETKTGLDARTLAQSLLMSTAEPMRDSKDRYYPILRQGAGMGHIGNAVTADSFILMGADATASFADGKVKVELGDDPSRDGEYTFTFTLHNITNKTKTYDLSADVFTMGCGEVDGVWYLDKITATLAADVTFNLAGEGGKTVYDFNGDGLVDGTDVEFLLAYVAGYNITLHNQDKADISGDGKITSYDAYLLATMEDSDIGSDSVEIPANGSVTLEVTIRLTDAQKKTLDEYYVDGAYIQAYVYAESDTTSHSIPVLGFYGNWSDPSMYDKGTPWNKHYPEVESRTPYLYGDLSKVNSMYYTDGDGTYYLGGNPAVLDPGYRPERNAINNKTGSIVGAGWTQIRNAGELYAVIRNCNTGAYITKKAIAEDGIIAAFYFVNAGQWYNHWFEETGHWNIAGIAENTSLEVGIVAVPEYYTLRDSYSFDELGSGAYMTVPVTIDNTKPNMGGYALLDNGGVLRIQATDNQYVAAVALLDVNGEMAAYTGARMDAQKGQTLDFDIDVSEVVGSKFYVQIYDYAGNIATYELNEKIGKVVDYVTGITITDSKTNLNPGEKYTFVAEVQPANASDRSVSWSTSNSRVATVDANGVVTGVKEGTCTITATSNLDRSYKASVNLTVSQSGVIITGTTTDQMEGASYIYQWNITNSEDWTAVKDLPDWMFSSAVQIPGTNTMYACEYSTYRLYKFNTSTGAAVSYDDTLGLPLSDMVYSTYFSTSSKPKIHAVEAHYLFVGGNPDSFDAGYFNCSSYLSSKTGATKWMAIASLGYEKYKNSKGETFDTEHLLLLDDKGYVWNWWVYKMSDGSYSAYFNAYASTLKQIVRMGYRTDENDLPHSFHSMHVGEDGKLYVSSYDWLDTDDGTRIRFNDIFALTLSGNRYSADFLNLTGVNVYPTSITNVTGSATGSNAVHAAPEFTADTEHMSAQAMDGQKLAIGADRFAVDAADTAKTLNAADITAKAEAKAEVLTAEKPMAENQVSLDILAKDNYGFGIAQTNGMFQISYDPTQLTMDMEASSIYGADYCVVHDNGAGVVTVAFVGPKRMEAGELLSEIVFDNHATNDTTVLVKHCDYNDTASGYVEYFNIKGATKHVEWISASTTLGGNIGLNFYVKLSQQLTENETTFMRFQFAGNTIDVPLADAVYTNGQYKFTCPVNAKNMTDTVSAQVMTADGAVGEGKSLAVVTYCNFMIQYGGDAALASLMKAMLNYGAAAQLLFNHNTGNLANAGLSEADKVLADVDASAYAASISGSEAGISVASASLMLETETSIRIYFRLTGSKTIDEFTFLVDGKEVTPVEKNGQYYVEITDIAAQDLDAEHAIAVGGIRIRYSGLSYVNTVMQNQSIAGEVLVNTAKALFAYNKLAESYFN